MPPSTIPWWRPESFAKRRPFLYRRNQILAACRADFVAEGFMEVETPALQRSPGLEPHLHAFATELIRPDQRRVPLYLHSSPEFAMKKLLVAGEMRIFQFAHVFRNGECSATHHPEFTMLEWYRAHADYRILMQDCERLLQTAATLCQRPLSWRGAVADPHAPWLYLTVAEAFERFAGIDILALSEDRDGLAQATRQLGLHTDAHDRWDDLFFRIFLDRIEPQLGIGVPAVLYDYPISMAALSRPKPDAPHLCERFELYVAGLELANGFGELTDPTLQRARFQADMDLKQSLYGQRYPVDESFLDALVFGMPPSAGIALGVDRLVMLATGAEDIEQVLWAPVREE